MSTHVFAPAFELPNFFAPARAPLAPEAVEPAEPVFALVKNGPPVPDHEVESHLDAVEVTVRWGSQVLSVTHLEAGKGFAVGEGADFVLPEDVLGGARLPIVTHRAGGAHVVVPRGARGSVTERGAQPASLEALIAQGALAASAELPGAHEIALTPGSKIVLELGAVRADGTAGEPVAFEIGFVRAGKAAPVSLLSALAGGALGFVGLSFLGHAAIVASMAMFMPSMAADDADAIDRDQIMLMQKLLNASAEREPDPPVETRDGPADEAAGGGSTGAPHKGESGEAGTMKHVTTNGHMGFKGNDARSAVSRKDEIQLARDFGMIGLIAASNRDPNAPATPWANEPYAGADEKSAMGKMFGATIDDAAGFGVGLWGTGEGGGGTADVIGLDRVNTVGGGGHGPGKWGIGDRDGTGIGHGPGQGGHKVTDIRMRTPDISTNGRLPAEVIQRIVRQNFGRFRLCYESGLRGNPGLTGRVATRFVIGRDGAVSTAQDAGSDLPDQKVVSCVVSSFHSLSFPQPEGGIATVTYPIVFSPGQ